jgi:mono/diheme cytochrome c family protein
VVRNPLEGNPDAIRNGMGYYRSRCADCHGIDARGVRAPDLAQVWASGRTDEGLFNTIRRGVAGTERPAFVPPRNPDVDIWQALASLRTLRHRRPPIHRAAMPRTASASSARCARAAIG